jgi:hypothetical protein
MGSQVLWLWPGWQWAGSDWILDLVGDMLVVVECMHLAVGNMRPLVIVEFVYSLVVVECMLSLVMIDGMYPWVNYS